MPKLSVESGKQSGAVLEVTDGMVIGRRLELPFTLEDPKASREHAKFVKHGDGFALVDLKSTNGTFLNGNRVQQSRLREGDRIRIGQTEMVFSDGGGEDEGPQPVPIDEDEDQPVDLGLPKPKRLKIKAPPPKTVSIKLQPKRRLPPRRKK